MNLEPFGLNLLVAVDAIIRLRSVTAAADELNLTQSAVSNALRRVRQHFGDEILYYNGRSMVPTALGQTLEKVVPEAISQLRTITRLRPPARLSEITREFTIIASDYVSAVYLPRVMRRFAREAPGITLEVMAHTEGAIRRFDRGEVDFIVARPLVDDPALTFDLVFEDEFLCVLADDNPLLADGFDRDAYLASPHVLTKFFAHNGMSHLERWFERQDFDVKVAGCLPNFVVLPFYVAGTHNVATVHSRLEPFFRDRAGVTFVKPPIDIPRDRECLVTRSHLAHDPEAQMMRDLLLDVGRQMS